MRFLLKQLLCVLSCVPLLAMASEPPRIGVVLGGGGARGFAHLGVLQELEKLHVPIACIAGTSAGALIGGMYANGLPLEEMKQSFKDADWNAMLSGKPNRADVPYERKNDDYKNFLDVTFGVRDGAFRVPRSAVNSQDIDLFIRQLTRDRVIDDFDHLPIPFRAVATDLSNGDAVVFDHGSLATALRASMAVPGLFDPVEDQGRMLIDGGVARNLPVEDLKHRCADRVIVVDVGTPLMASDQIHTLFDVLAQTSNLMVTRNVRQQKALLDENDIVIRPDLNGFTSASFADNQAIIRRGAEAVTPLRARLAALAASPEAYRDWQAHLVRPESPKIDEVRVVANNDGYINPQLLAKRLEQENSGDTLSSTRASLRQLFASGDYDSLTYRVENQDGRNVVDVMPIERSVGPNYLRFGLNLKSSTSGDSTFTFLASHLRTWINSAGASWRTDLQLGSDKLLKSEFYQPFAADSPVFMALNAGYKETAWPFFSQQHDKYAQLNQTETHAGLDAGVTLGKYGELRTGAYWRQTDPRVSMGTLSNQDMQQAQKQHEAGWRLTAVADQFDNPRWPRKGYFFDGDLRYAVPSWGSVDSRYYALTAEDAQTFGDVTVRMTSKLKGNLGTANPGHYFTPQFLGGFLNMSGYQQDELYGERVALGRLMVYWRAATLPSALGSGLYAGGSLELGKVWNRGFTAEDSEWLPGSSVFIGADTILGPLFIGFGNARGGRMIGYMFLGVDY